MNEEQLATMQHLLATCLVPDNAVRKAAEESITAHLNAHREPFLFGLIKLVRQSPAAEVRVLSAIILRQTLPQGDTVLFRKLAPELQRGIQTELLAAIVHEPERYVRSQIADTVAALAAVLLYDNSWPGLFDALYSMCSPAQTNEGIKLCALDILGELSDAADNLLGQVPALHSVFAQTLSANNSLLVRVHASASCCKIVCILEDPAHTKEYKKFIPAFFGTLTEALKVEDEDSAKKVLSALIEIATEEPKFFTDPHTIQQLIELMYTIGADTAKHGWDDGVRQYACELLLGVAEGAPVLFRKSQAFIKHAILVCLSLMLDVDDDPTWGQKTDSSDFYDNSNFDYGEVGIDRIGQAVKGKKLWGILQPILHVHVGNKQDWKMRHAGIAALTQAASAVPFEVLPVKELCGFLEDPHPRVRYAAVQCLGRLPLDFQGVVQTKWHKVLYPGLMKPLTDNLNPRVQALAASALLNVTDDCPGNIVKLYLAPLMDVLLVLLQNAAVQVQVQVLLTMASLAGQSPRAFAPYYGKVVPLMIFIIQNAVTKDTRLLRARAMESVSYIGMYVGKERFYEDAKTIVRLFLDIMQQSRAAAGQKKAPTSAASAAAAAAAEDDYSEQHMLQAWTRICATLKAEFVPILPYVMPLAFEIIRRKGEGEGERVPGGQVHRIEDDSAGGAGVDEDEQPEDDDGEPDANVGKDGMVKSISASAGRKEEVSDRPQIMAWTSHVHTALLEEKANAMQMVCMFAHDLREHFMPYVKETSMLFIPMLDHYSDELQTAAIEIMPHLLRCAIEGHKAGTASVDFVKAIVEAIIVQMIEVFPREVDAQILQLMVISLHDCIDAAGTLVRSVIDGPMLQKVGTALLRMLHESHKRIERREALLKKEEEEDDMDEERIMEIEECNAGEDGLNKHVADCINTLIQQFGVDFLPVFDSLYREVLRMLSVNSLDSTKQIATFILDDIYEHLGPAAAKYFPTLETLCIYACELNGEHGLRQAAAYGLNMAAKHGGPQFVPFRDEIAKRLLAAITADPTYLQRLPNQKVGYPWRPKNEDDEGAPDTTVRKRVGPMGEQTVPDDEDDEEEDEEGEDGEEDSEPEDDPDDPSRTDDEKSRHSALDNLVAALASIAHHQSRPDLYPTVLAMLPLRIDNNEGVFVYNMLLDLLDVNHPLIIGDNFANLPKILHIFLSVWGTTFLQNKDLRRRTGKFFFNVKQMPAALLQQVVPHLQKHEQDKLAVILEAIGQ